VLVHVLDHHYRAIDHRADGNRDTAQGHDVSVQSLQVHDHKRAQYPDRKTDNNH
jgi:hypothetical protein